MFYCQLLHQSFCLLKAGGGVVQLLITVFVHGPNLIKFIVHDADSIWDHSVSWNDSLEYTDSYSK
jgi:hypothetical protein